MMEFTSNIDGKIPLYSIHIHYFPAVLPPLFYRGIFSIADALVFTAVLHIFNCGGREVRARSKDQVLPQPDGSIVSGGTVSLSSVQIHGDDVSLFTCILLWVYYKLAT